MIKKTFYDTLNKHSDLLNYPHDSAAILTKKSLFIIEKKESVNGFGNGEIISITGFREDRLKESTQFNKFKEAVLQAKNLGLRITGLPRMLITIKYDDNKVEITTDEPVLLPVEERPVLHGFDENINTRIQVYALPEIVAEKLRALLQSQQRLSKRGWGASRVCRDYYDLWYVLGRGALDAALLPDLLARKCALRQVTFDSVADFLAPELQAVARAEWDAEREHQRIGIWGTP